MKQYLLYIGFFFAFATATTGTAAHQQEEVMMPFTKKDALLAGVTAVAAHATWHLLSLRRNLTEREAFMSIKVQILILASLLHCLSNFIENSRGVVFARKILFNAAAYYGGMAILEGWVNKAGGSIPYKAAQILVGMAIIVFTHIDKISGCLRR